MFSILYLVFGIWYLVKLFAGIWWDVLCCGMLSCDDAAAVIMRGRIV